MIAMELVNYLKNAGVPFTRHWHETAIRAQKLAESLHLTGWQVAKTVIVDVDGERWMAVLPAPERLDEERLANALGAKSVRLVDEGSFRTLFADCEVGAEPAFGRLYGLPVILDEALAREPRLVMRAGSHEETVELRTQDYLRLEHPRIASIGRIVGWAAAGASAEARA